MALKVYSSVAKGLLKRVTICQKALRDNFYVWRSYSEKTGRVEGPFCPRILNMINGLKVNVSPAFFQFMFHLC